MNKTRRDFLKGTTWMGITAAAAGCMSDGFRLTPGGSMMGWADRPLEKLRVGVIGLGMRGPGALHILAMIPGVEVTALCDKHPERVEQQQKWLRENGHRPAPKTFSGEEGYKRLCEDDEVDLVYSATPWQLHVPIALYAMEHGKHVATEVPSAFTVEECWQLVETSERTRRHCIQLENCCYGEIEMLTLNMARKGLFGELKHAECAYIHDLRECCYQDPNVNKVGYGVSGYMDYWRLKWNNVHKGNQYPTHGLGPVCWYFDVNRGDRLDYLVSVDSHQAGYEAFARATLAADNPLRGERFAMADMNVTTIRTAKGRTIMLQHDVSSPRPYSRLNLIAGTKGVFRGYPRLEIYLEGGDEWPRSGGHHAFSEEATARIRAAYAHPLVKQVGDIAKNVGGHGGMDYLMDLRWAYCLQRGLPLDTDVYDLASWCAVSELTERSARSRARTMDVPDFTRGAWKTPCNSNLMDATIDAG